MGIIEHREEIKDSVKLKSCTSNVAKLDKVPPSNITNQGRIPEIIKIIYFFNNNQL